MEQRPDVIVIAGEHEEDVYADRADLVVTVEGSSLVTGRAALTKAREVSKLVEALAACGVGQDDISLDGVTAEVSSGFLGKSSSAKYRLRIRCSSLEALPDVLGAVTGAKNARLDEVAWHYPESAEQQGRWLTASIAQANTKAVAAAAALGTRIVGIHRLTEERVQEVRHQVAFGADLGYARRSAVDLGFDLSHQKKAGLRITIEYRVEGFEPK